jgi:hypothetical protein
MKRIPAPSPNGTNNERLFLVKMPHSQPLGALDAMKPHERAMRDEYLGRAEYDRAHEAEDEEESEGRSRMRAYLAERGCNDEDIDELFSMLDREPEAEDNVEEEDDLQRNGREGSMGGRVSEYDREAGDRKRMARDRRRQMASDAADERAEQSFDQMFPDAARIRIGGF